MTNDIANTSDLIDVRDIIKRVEELNATHDYLFDNANDEDASAEEKEQSVKAFEEWQAEEDGECAERATLTALLAKLCGNGGDEQWEGDWYPVTLVNESYFKEHAQTLAEDCGMINSEAKWPNNCIDWDTAASELKSDYMAIDYDGVTYWYR